MHFDKKRHGDDFWLAPRLRLEYNRTEQALRVVAVGYNNWIFID
jgi:hypothetical protein